MPEDLYQVVLLQQTASWIPIENVRANLARAFQVEEATIDALLAKAPTIIKSSIDKATAEIFRDAIIRSGAECEIRDQPPQVEIRKSPLPGKRTSIPIMLDAPDEEQILQVLRHFQPQDGFHVHPKIPERKLKNALERCRVHPMETVLALIDCTVFGSAKNCILITSGGLYYSNDATARVPGGALPFFELARRAITPSGEFDIDLGTEDSLETSGSPMERERIMELLLGLSSLFRTP
jgi:hypothetical protein